MSSARFAVLVTLGIVFVGLGLAAFTVNERELAIKLRVGEVISADYEAGLDHDRGGLCPWIRFSTSTALS